MLASWGIDGNWFNIATFVVAAFCIFVRPVRRHLSSKHSGKCWQADKAVFDFLNGLAVFPFAVMPLTVASTALLAVVKDNLQTLAAAGFVGFIYVVSEVVTAGRDD